MQKVIEKIIVKKAVDEYPELSWLKTDYSYDEESKELKIISSCQYTNEDIKTHGTDEVLRWIKQDEKRLNSYGDQWCMLYIYAEAHLTINGTCQEIHSAGLFGIESDSESSYFDEVAREKVSELKDLLKEVGFTEEQINEAKVIDFDELESLAVTVAEFMEA